MEEHSYEGEPEAGRRGGSTEAYVTSGVYPAAGAAASLLRRFRWDGVLAGTFVAVATMMLLSALGVAIGLTYGELGPGGGLAYWVVGSAAIGLFAGSWLASRFANLVHIWTAVAHGITIWSLFMILDRLGIDLIGGMSRFLFAGVGAAALTPGTNRDVLMDAGWWFFIGYLIALAAAVLGSVAGLGTEDVDEIP